MTGAYNKVQLDKNQILLLQRMNNLKKASTGKGVTATVQNQKKLLEVQKQFLDEKTKKIMAVRNR